MNNQISMFVEEVQEDEDQGQQEVPSIDTDDLDNEFVKFTSYHLFKAKQQRSKIVKLIILPTIGYGHVPFSPPELIVTV